MLYQDKERLLFIDIFKALAIILVVLGHVPVPLRNHSITQWIYSFHMPAFFAVYGMTYHPQHHKESGWLSGKFLVQKVKRLLVPCFTWGLIYAAFSLKNLAFIAYGSQQSFIGASSLSSLWFLTCMFLAVCAFEVIMQVAYRFASGRARAIILAIAAVFLYSAGNFVPRLLLGYPWCADDLLIALAFILLGYGIRCVIKYVKVLNRGNVSVWLVILLLSLLLSFSYLCNLGNISGNNVDFATRALGNPILYVLTATGGILFLTALSVLLSKVKYLKNIAVIGVYSMPIYLLHKFPLTVASNYLSSRGIQTPWVGLLIAFAVILLSYAAARLLRLIAPNLIGLDSR